MQSLNVTDTSEDTVYIVCLFNTFSTDSGCTVVLVSTTDQQQQYEGTFNKTDDNTASGNITGVVTGVYNIHAFDQGSDVVAVELLNVTITGEPSSTINSTATDPTNSTPDPDNNNTDASTSTDSTGMDWKHSTLLTRAHRRRVVVVGFWAVLVSVVVIKNCNVNILVRVLCLIIVIHSFMCL